MTHYRREGVVLVALLTATLAVPVLSSADDAACIECHGSVQQITDAASALDVKLDDARAAKLAVGPRQAGAMHADVACVDCHPGATELPHPKTVIGGNPCASCHEDALAAVNKSVHRDPSGGSHLKNPCWGCHGEHSIFPVKDSHSLISPSHVAERCLACHNKREYLIGEHGRAVQLGGLDVAATCVSCHGGHDIQKHGQESSRVNRRNISFTCGKCHDRVAQAYRRSVHGAALTEKDNPDVPTCVDCHKAHNTASTVSARFRLDSPQTCGHCHANPEMMGKYGLSTAVFDTYVADFHGTTAELFRSTSPDQPLNKAVCYDCHGYHDVTAVHNANEDVIAARLLVKCQACHPDATPRFLTAWTGHYVPTPQKYPLIYWVKAFYKLIIPGTVGFFLAYIAVDVWGRRRQRRKS
jgi:hypothetical protein